jgi:glycine/D-amino acid oxidase-like deaminating enzyme
MRPASECGTRFAFLIAATFTYNSAKDHRVKLRSGTPYWTALEPTPIPLSPLAGELRCEVLVIGGGITGALIAYQLTKNGVHTALIDRHEVGRGSTAASTGLLQYEIDTPLVDLIHQVGEAHAVHAYRRGLQAVDEIEQLVDELGDRCGFARRESLYFASHWWHRRRLKREYECRRQVDFDVDYLSRRQLADVSTIDSVGAIRSRGDAQINPLRFTNRLITGAIRQGLVAHGNTPAERIDERADGVIVETPKGLIRSQKIIYATGYEAELPEQERKGSLSSTYAVVSQPNLELPDWPNRCLIWETARPYFYARQTDDGRAMIGGADTAFSNDHDRDALVERKIARLVKRFEKLFPNTEFIPEYAWAGTFAGTRDGLAYIGQPPKRPRAYIALGYGGNGITFSVIAAKLICDLLAGRKNPDQEVFRFDR